MPPPATIDDKEKIIQKQIARAAGRPHGGIRQNQISCLASEGGRLFDLLTVETYVQKSIVGFHAFGSADHRYVFCRAAWSQSHIDCRGLVRAQLKLPSFLGRKVRRAHAQLVTSSQRQTGDRVTTAGIALRFASQTSLLIRQNNPSTGNRRAVRINDLSSNRCGIRSLRQRRETREEY